MSVTRFFAKALAFGVVVLGAGVVWGQDYPSKPIRILTSAAGGGGDFTTRLVAQGISAPLGQQVIVDNRASAVLAAEVVAKSPPDGYTLVVGSAILWVTAMLRKTPFDVERDFSPVVLIERSPNIVTVHPSLPVKSMKELIALAKARPGELHYGSSGVASADHIIAELLKHMTGINIVHVPYKGIAPAHTALLSGEVQVAFGSIASSAPHVKSGRMRALGITSAQPSALVPGLPPVADAVPGFETQSITGMWAPTKTPRAIIDRLSQEILRLLSQAEVKTRFLAAGVETVGLPPDQFGEYIKSDIVRISRVIKDAGIKVD